MAGLRTLVIRDPETGELRFAQGLKPTEICALVRVAQSLLPTPPPVVGLEEREESGEEQLARLTDADLKMLLSWLQIHGEEGAEKGETPDADAN